MKHAWFWFAFVNLIACGPQTIGAESQLNQTPENPQSNPIKDPLAGTKKVTLCDVQSQVFDVSCVRCHKAGASAAFLDLQSSATKSSLVSVNSPDYKLPYVVAGNPDASFLYQKITNPQGKGSLMPLGSKLSQAHIDLVRKWIADGAQLTCE